jgi:hypothetical protein
VQAVGQCSVQLDRLNGFHFVYLVLVGSLRVD